MMEDKINLNTLLIQNLDDKYLNNLLLELSYYRQELKYYKDRLLENKKEIDSVQEELYKAIDDGDTQLITTLKEKYNGLVKDYKNRLESRYEAEQSYQKYYNQIEELIDFDENKAKSISIKDFDKKTLATFKVCCDFIGSLVRFHMITSGKADSDRYAIVTSLAWRATRIHVSHLLSSSEEEKKKLGLDDKSDKEAYKYIYNLLSNVDYSINDSYKNWKTEEVEYLLDFDENKSRNYYEMPIIFSDSNKPIKSEDLYDNNSNNALSKWFRQNFKTSYLAKRFKYFSESRKKQEDSCESFKKAENDYSLARNDFYKALDETHLDNLKELKYKMEKVQKDLELAQKNYSSSKREYEFAYKWLSEAIDYDGQNAWKDYQDSDYSFYTYKICSKLLISMVKIFKIKELESNSEYYSQITSKIWRLARLKIIQSISSNPKKKKNLGLSELNDKESRDYLKKLLKHIDYKYDYIPKYYDLKYWREKDVYVHGWRIEPFGKDLLKISLMEEEKQKDKFTDELYDDIEDYIIKNAAQKFRNYYNDDEFADAERVIKYIFGLPAFWCGDSVDDLIAGNILDIDSAFVVRLRMTMWEKEYAESLMEMLDCIDGCDNPWDFLYVVDC